MSIFTKIKGIVRINNQTAHVQGDEVNPTYDQSGRQVTYPYTVRELMGTAKATLANNAADNATSLIAGDSSVFNDLLYVSGANNSDKAVRIVFRDGSAGSDAFNLTMAASSTQDIKFPIPYLQNTKGLQWTVDFDTNANIVDPNDVTNTTVTVLAQFIKQI